MSEPDLLAAIVANPDDDDLRLVYADVLEGRGDPRGELIQLQCRLARATPTDDTAALTARLDELMAEHRPAWLAPLLEVAPRTEFRFHRGFVEEMFGHYPAATVEADALLARAPLLSSLTLTVHGQRERGELARPRSTAVLARARSLSIRGRKRGNTRDARGPIADLGALSVLPFARLRRLQLAHVRTHTDDLVALLCSPHLAGLELLALNLRLSPDEMAPLPKVFATQLPQLVELDLRGNLGVATFLRESHGMHPRLRVITD